MRLIDLSRPLENTADADPPGFGPRIEYSDHKQSLSGMLAMFPGLEASQLPSGEAWAVELLTVTTHNGTHVDAPWHFASTMNRGERAWTIDEVPLDWFYRPGIKLDFRDCPDGHVVTAAEVAERVGATGHELKPLDIVLMNTRAAAPTTLRLTSIPAADSGERLHSGCLSVAFGSWERTAGAGTLRSPSRGADFWTRAIHRSFGKATKRVSILAIVISKS